MHRAGQARTQRPAQTVKALRRCADCGGPFNRGGRTELARARSGVGGVGELPHPRGCPLTLPCEVARCSRCQGYGHVSRGSAHTGKKDACWRCGGASQVTKECMTPPRCLTCANRGKKDVARASGSGSCPVFRAELRRLRGGK